MHATTGSNRGFWEYEWDKHGTCAESFFPTQNDYFQAAIEWNNKYEVNDALRAAGLDPSALTTTSADEVAEALEAAWGVAPEFSCEDGK